MGSYQKYRDEALKNDPELREAYEALAPEYNIIQAMIDALTVAENAERMKETEL